MMHFDPFKGLFGSHNYFQNGEFSYLKKRMSFYFGNQTSFGRVTEIFLLKTKRVRNLFGNSSYFQDEKNLY